MRAFSRRDDDRPLDLPSRVGRPAPAVARPVDRGRGDPHRCGCHLHRPSPRGPPGGDRPPSTHLPDPVRGGLARVCRSHQFVREDRSHASHVALGEPDLHLAPRLRQIRRPGMSRAQGRAPARVLRSAGGDLPLLLAVRILEAWWSRDAGVAGPDQRLLTRGAGDPSCGENRAGRRMRALRPVHPRAPPARMAALPRHPVRGALRTPGRLPPRAASPLGLLAHRLSPGNPVDPGNRLRPGDAPAGSPLLLLSLPPRERLPVGSGREPAGGRMVGSPTHPTPPVPCPRAETKNVATAQGPGASLLVSSDHRQDEQIRPRSPATR